MEPYVHVNALESFSNVAVHPHIITFTKHNTVNATNLNPGAIIDMSSAITSGATILYTQENLANVALSPTIAIRNMATRIPSTQSSRAEGYSKSVTAPLSNSIFKCSSNNYPELANQNIFEGTQDVHNNFQASIEDELGEFLVLNRNKNSNERIANSSEMDCESDDFDYKNYISMYELASYDRSELNDNEKNIIKKIIEVRRKIAYYRGQRIMVENCINKMQREQMDN